mgnify:CR=1 FL=1
MDILKNPHYLLLLSVLMMLDFNGCSNTPETSKDKVADETQNSLEPKIMIESISDWVVLFDLQTHSNMDAWTGFNQEAVPGNWEIIDGILTVSKQGDAVEKNTGFGQSIVSRDLFDNFELEIYEFFQLLHTFHIVHCLEYKYLSTAVR